MSIDELTKKEQILHLARKDPFLRVEEIATRVRTTPRYVRTILSEARLSLMQLRREYARTMERRLGVNVTVDGSGRGLADALSLAGNQVGVHQVRVVKGVVREWAEILGVDPGEPLLRVSRVRIVNGRPFFLNEVVTHRNLMLSDDLGTSEKPLRQLLGLEVPGKTQYVDRSLEVERANAYVAACLGIAEGDPVIVSGNVIVTMGERVGIEFNHFDAYRVRFVLTGTGEYTLKIVEKVGGVDRPA